MSEFEAQLKAFCNQPKGPAPPQEQNKRADGMLLLAYHHFSGMGLPKGASFQPGIDIPAFAERIRAEVG